jgi:undecaprenyl-diphosphatase
VSAGGRLVAGDGRLLRAVRRTALAHPGTDRAAHVLCDLGDIEVAVPVLLVALVVAARWGRRAGLSRWWVPPAAAALAMCLLPVVVGAVKSGVDRPAPGRVHPDPNYGYFPSGHTATSSVGYGLAALVLLPCVRRRAARVLLAAGTALLALAVGVALVWCDYHWPLDVAGSWCLAVALLSAAAAARWVPGAGFHDGAGSPGGGPGGEGPTGPGGGAAAKEPAAGAVRSSSGSPGSDPRGQGRASAG